jgi:hypothetical protein
LDGHTDLRSADVPAHEGRDDVRLDRGARGPTLKRRLLLALIAAAAVAGAVVALTAHAPRHRDQGIVHFLGGSNQAFDRFTSGLDPSYGAFLRRHMWRMVVYSPYFDDKTRWYPNGWAYEDAYAIYRESALASQHPEWILRDQAGRPLFIPFACSRGGCPQYAADISSPAFRRQWIDRARASVAHGYRGLFIDDVNMAMRVGDGEGRPLVPIDRATGRPMRYDAWRGYMAQFMEEVRAAIPHAELVHNVIWLAASPIRTADPFIRREIRAADYINLERGVNDSGLTGGGGPMSLSSLLAYVDAVHGLGRGAVLDGAATEAAGIEYSLAGYFLISEGNDLVSAHGMTPAHWWTGFDVNLGEAKGPRYNWKGLVRRDFARGMSLVAAPERVPHSVTLPTAMRTLDGRTVTSLELAPASGAVLLRH